MALLLLLPTMLSILLSLFYRRIICSSFSHINAGFWMAQRKKEIIANRMQNVQATAEITSQWTAYSNSQVVAARTTNTVSPLVQTLWDQPYPYNASVLLTARQAARPRRWHRL